MTSTDNQPNSTDAADLTGDQLAARHRMLDKLDAICAEHPGVAAANLAALTANYRAGLPAPAAGGEQPEHAPEGDEGNLAEVDRHTIEVAYAAPDGDLEIEQVTVTCACGEAWTTYLPFGAYEVYRSGETDLAAPFLARWRDHVHAACGLDTPPQPVGVLAMALEAIEQLVDERGEIIAERDAALARLDSEEIHEGCTADLEKQKDLTAAAWAAHDAAAADARDLRAQRAAILAFGSVLVFVLVMAIVVVGGYGS